MKVAVFFGGASCEREISVLTGVFVLNTLDREQYDLLPIYIHTDGGMYTSPKMFDLNVFREKRYASFTRIFIDGGSMYALNAKKGRVRRIAKIDVALNCCHGGLGEGGGVSALTEWNGIPLASPDTATSAIFMDKCLTKAVLESLNVPTLEYIRVNERDYEKRGAFLLHRIETRFGYPVVVKPAHLGSSIGISVARNEAEVKSALQAAFVYDGKVLIEPFLEQKQDVNCAAYGVNGEVYVSEAECAFGAGLYTFEEKYEKRTKDGANGQKQEGRYLLTGDLREKIRAYTKTVYKRMGLSGAVRMDYLVSEDKAYLCEVNTVPGSLAYYLFCERISDTRVFFGDLLEEAYRRGNTDKKQTLSTGILKKVSWQGKR